VDRQIREECGNENKNQRTLLQSNARITGHVEIPSRFDGVTKTSSKNALAARRTISD